jgi:hypothetical protein
MNVAILPVCYMHTKWSVPIWVYGMCRVNFMFAFCVAMPPPTNNLIVYTLMKLPFGLAIIT